MTPRRVGAGNFQGSRTNNYQFRFRRVCRFHCNDSFVSLRRSRRRSSPARCCCDADVLQLYSSNRTQENKVKAVDKAAVLPISQCALDSSASYHAANQQANPVVLRAFHWLLCHPMLRLLHLAFAPCWKKIISNIRFTTSSETIM